MAAAKQKQDPRMDIKTGNESFIIAAFSLIASAPLCVLGFIHIQTQNAANGLIELVATMLILTNFLVYLRTKNAQTTKFILTLAVSLVLNAVLITGGINGTGIFWWLMFPVAAFFLNGRKRGLAWVVVVYAFSVMMLVLSAAGIVYSAYSPSVVRQMWVVMLVISALAYAYEKNSEERSHSLFIEREKLFSILESLPIGVFLAEAPTGKFVVVNKAANQLLGRTLRPQTMMATTPQSHVTGENGEPYPAQELPLAITLRTGESAEKKDISIQRPDGTKIAVQVVSVPVKDGEGRMRFVAVMFRDITKEREIDRMKSEFVALASHQLRTPLTGIKWFTELLANPKASGAKLKPAQQEYVDQIGEINGHLLKLVSDLLNVSHIETGRKFNLEVKPTDLRPILNSIKTGLAGVAAVKKIKIKMARTLPKRLVLSIDGSKMREVFENLLSNAIKYSNKGGFVEIGFDGSNPGEAVIYVRDNGVGIPKEQQRRIFEKFFRADNAQKSGVEGTGLGLYIAKSIAEKNNGRMWFESEENKGTTFYVGLPR